MWVQVGSLYRVLELLLRRQEDGLMKCPACKGSGSTLSTKNQIISSHYPSSARLCQFCEGFKILPVTGLTESIPVRAATCLQIQDCLGKKPGICWKPQRHLVKRKNYLREKIKEAAEARAHCTPRILLLAES